MYANYTEVQQLRTVFGSAQKEFKLNFESISSRKLRDVYSDSN